MIFIPSMITMLVRVHFGPFPVWLAKIVGVLNLCTFVRHSFVINELCFVKNLQLFKFRIAASLNDKFWLAFLLAFNLVIGAFWALLDSYWSHGTLLPDFYLLTKNWYFMNWHFDLRFVLAGVSG